MDIYRWFRLFECFWFSVVNFVWYQEPIRIHDPELLESFNDDLDLAGVKLLITRVLLNCSGLDVSEESIHPLVYLTPDQRKVRGMVEKYGYKVGLLRKKHYATQDNKQKRFFSGPQRESNQKTP